jgi:hypothetical protein
MVLAPNAESLTALANNGQQRKSPGSEAGARLGFDGSNNNGRPLSPQH